MASLIFVTVLSLTHYVRSMPRSMNMPPGPFPLPVIGNFHELGKAPAEGHIHVIQTLAAKYGDLFSLKLGSVYAIVVSDYKMLVDLFVKKSQIFSDRPVDTLYMMQYLNKTLGIGIFTNNGHSWKNMRKTSLTTMRDFGVGKHSLEEKIQEEIGVLLETLNQQKQQPYNAKPLFTMATSNITCQIMFGSRFDYEDEKFLELMRVLEESFTVDPILNSINFFPFLKYLPYFKDQPEHFTRVLTVTADYLKSLTVENETTFDPENIRDFVDLFIKMRREHADDETYDERSMVRTIVDLFSAGSDTTAITLSWGLMYLAKYPDVQRKCQQEIDDVIGKGKMPTLSEREKLPYVEAMIMEVLRIRPAGPAGVPHVANRDVEINGYRVPKNTMVISNLVSMNMDPRVFPNPERFDPGHFLNEEGKITNRDRMVTFSIGPRSCLGEILAKMELSLYFTSILQFFTISPEPGKPIDMSPITTGAVMTHNMQNLVFARRD